MEEKKDDLKRDTIRKRDRIDNELKELESELSKTKYNKRTQFHIGLVKAKIAKLKEKRQGASKGQKGTGFNVRKTGDGTVVLLGFPSVGKSTLLNALTNAKSKIASYAFTTLTCIPGLMEYKHAKIQILDVPGIVEGAAAGTGRGREVLQVLRSADLALIIVDVFSPEHYKVILKEVYDSQIRLNQKKPNVKITKSAKGGILIGKTVKLEMSDESIRSIMREFRLNNAEILIREPINEDQLIDIIEGNKHYIPSVVVVNKTDLAAPSDIERLKKLVTPDLYISAETGQGIVELREIVFQKLDLMRIYLKEVNKPADMEVPMIIFRKSTLRNVCEKLHRDFIEKFKFARIWGKSVRFKGMKVLKLDHVLEDEDVVELHLN